MASVELTLNCAFPSCRNKDDGKNGFTTEDKKYFFCSIIHKYSMVKSLNLCKTCNKYLSKVENNKHNICLECASKQICVECSCTFKECSYKFQGAQEKALYCEVCIEKGEINYFICCSRCYHKHLHTQEQNHIPVTHVTEIGCGHVFPYPNSYKCLVCQNYRNCSYECLQIHYANYHSTSEVMNDLHRQLLCSFRGCKVILSILGRAPYYIPCECCSFCTKECCFKELDKDKNCVKCGCRNANEGLCLKCIEYYCIVCKNESKLKCKFRGQNCDKCVCENEECKRKHDNITHKLNAVNLCIRRGCFSTSNQKFTCKCGAVFCSNECKIKTQLFPCDKCDCSHRNITCHIVNCDNIICGNCERFCNICKENLKK